MDAAYYELPDGYDHPEVEEKRQTAIQVMDRQTMSELNAEIKSLNKRLYDAGIFAWESSRFIELLIEVHQTHMALSAAGMTSTAAKSIDACLYQSAAQ